MSAPIFRIDKFVVPAAARAEFLQRVNETHEILRQCDGFLRDEIFEQCGGDGRFNILTLVEWSDMDAVDAAGAAVRAARNVEGFDPAAFMAQNGIIGDLALYRRSGE